MCVLAGSRSHCTPDPPPGTTLHNELFRNKDTLEISRKCVPPFMVWWCNASFGLLIFKCVWKKAQVEALLWWSLNEPLAGRVVTNGESDSAPCDTTKG